jgi:hypothetical protein
MCPINNIFMKKINILILIMFFYCHSLFGATVVHDPISAGHLLDQLLELDEHYKMFEKQYKTLNDQYGAITGANDNSEFFEEILDIGEHYDFWDWTPDISDIEDMVEGGYQAGSLSDRIEYYNKKYGEPHSQEDFVSHSPDHNTAVVQADQAIYSRAGMGMGHEAFDRSNEFHEAYEKQRSVAGTHLTQKQAVDYSNQLLLQMTAILNEILKIESMQLQLLALMTKTEDTTNEFNSRFFQSNY